MLPTPPTQLPDRPKLPIPEAYWVIPDRLLAGEYPGAPFVLERTRQRIDAFLEAGFDTFIDLTCAGEILPYEAVLREQAGAYGIAVQYLRFPIRDFGLPSLEEMKATLDAIDAGLSQGRKIYLHCYGGIGRTGTTVGCFLVRQGRNGAGALEQLADWWQYVPKHTRFPNSPQTLAQEDFVLNWQG
jgi:hypothetical protein